MTPERALVHDARCEREDPVDWDSCRCAERALAAARQREEEAKGEIARLKRIECWWCGRAPSDEPAIQLTRLNPKGLRGVFECQHCSHEMTRELAALRAENDRLTLAASESARTLQVRIAELEAGERHCDEYHGELADQVTALREAVNHYIGTLATGSVCLIGHPCSWPNRDHRHWNEIETGALFELQKAAVGAIPQDGA